MSTSVVMSSCPKCGCLCVDEGSNCCICGYSQTPSQSAISPILVRAIWAILIAIACVAAALCVYSNAQVIQSDAYKDALQKAFSSPEVQEMLGAGIHVKYFALGHLSTFQDSQFAEWSVALAGSHGSGHLYGVANRINDAWVFSRLYFKTEDGRNTIELTAAHRLSLPNVPAKKVYLVPIGLSGDENLAWVPGYYKNKFDIDVIVMPKLDLTSDLIDQKRDQLNSDKCVDLIEKHYPELDRDPSVLLISLTSKDMFIPGFGWRYAENVREAGRFALISTARVRLPIILDKMNPAWASSRLEKLLTKNIALLYFDLPMSGDYTSLLSGGVLSGSEVDRMAGRIVGSEGRWDPFVEPASPAVTIYDLSGRSPFWRMSDADTFVRDSGVQAFSAWLESGLFIQRKIEFLFRDEPNLQFSRVSRNQDERSRAFGIGGSHSLDMFLGGQMGVAVDLIMEDGARVHFVYQPPSRGVAGGVYHAIPSSEPEFRDAEATFSGDTWQVKTADGWTYFFPYRPQALPQYVTVLTSFIDPEKHRYEMKRDVYGCLLELNSWSGKWLHFENDSQHRIRKITSSSGRSVEYEYDSRGHLTRAKDSDGHVDSYTYDEKGQMLTVAHEDGKPVLQNDYFIDGWIKSQTMADGRKFEYAYSRQGNVLYESLITDPNGLETYIQYVDGGYRQWLPAIKH